MPLQRKLIRTLSPGLLAISACTSHAAVPNSQRESAAPDTDPVVVADTNIPGVANAWANTVALTPWAEAHGAPTLQQFPVAEVYRGRPAPVDFRPVPRAREYRTVLEEGAAAGPNFAGRYTVVVWGCGSPCVQFAILDAPTGHILLYQPDSTYIRPPMYGLRSRLLVDDPTGFMMADSLGRLDGTVTYYEWTGSRLRVADTLVVDHVRVPMH
ncbi:MAG TPA: hypothetical protein VFI39_10105 [Gemmatimonadales bacterium]|nr:hypothetical protein [Gemmatimonadales bacterium]